MKKVTTVGIDLAKLVFHIHGIDERGKVVLRKKVHRSGLVEVVAKLSPCLIGLEACGGAHYWAREFEKYGHKVRMISPQFVKPYVKSNKNDMADAEAICEAVSRPTMRFVPIKSLAQQDILSVHRVRERLVKNHTALTNEIRGLLHEYGIVLPQGRSAVYKGIATILAKDDERLTPQIRLLVGELLEELGEMDERIEHYDARIKAIHEAHPVCRRLAKIPGVGPLTATALLAAVGDAQVFRNGRQLSAWLGLVPRQHSTGGKPKLLGISKRGDVYLRKLLVHGARSTLRYVGKKDDPVSRWSGRLLERRGWNKTAVALANKNARMAWAIMARDEEFKVA